MVARTALLAAALLLAACQPAAPAGTPSTSTSGSMPVAAADARLYAGDYDGAERAYQKLAAAGDAVAEAHYALLLDYEDRFGEAIAAARRAVGQSDSSETEAYLTRALDWAEEVDGAVAAGAGAVSGRDAGVLAHAWYGEALADAGRYPAARAQLLLAERRASGAGQAAEVERDWANYYRDQGDTLEELNHLELSLKDQPGFPERVFEMARFRYSDQEQASARKLLDAQLKQHSGDYGVDLAGASVAFVQGDVDEAEPYYRAALKLQPQGVEASLGEAELRVSSTKRDYQGAHDLLLPALRAHPDAAGVYRYLFYLDSLVLKTDPAAELAALVPTPPSQEADAGAVLDRVNSFRSTLGLAALAESGPVAAAAAAHAYFWLFNYGQAAVADTAVHSEDASLPGAFGADPLARARHFGYAGGRVAEVVSHVYAAGASVQHWVDAVYHRYPLSDPETTSFGFGEAEVGALSIQVLDLGQDPAARHDAVVYPVPGQVGVPSAFLGDEVPDPAPGAHYPSGYPITVQVGSGSVLRVLSAELLGPDGANLSGYALDSGNSSLGANQWSVLPRDPLQAGASYTVKLAGTVDGAQFAKTWSFTVASTPA